MRKNYARDLRRWLDRFPDGMKEGLYAPVGVRVSAALESLAAAQKFVLPEGGDIIDTSAIKVLTETDLIRLPYQTVALEYDCGDNPNPVTPGWETSTANKRILILEERDDGISLRGMWQFQCNGQWHITPCMVMTREAIADVSKMRVEGDGGLPYQILCDFQPSGTGSSDFELVKEQIGFDLLGEWNVALRFMAALACSNVETQRIPVPKIQRRKKTAYPYDDYHQLVITTARSASQSSGDQGDRRTPREHLRRGHIRRLPTGKRIWVNAAVINAGVGGRVKKDYAIH